MSIYIDSLKEAKAYFMGLKRLSAEQFDNIYQVDIIPEIKNNNTKGLMFGNQ